MAEKRQLLDFFGLREAYRTGEMGDIARVASEHNPTDALSKLYHGGYFDTVLSKNLLRHLIEEHVAHEQLEMPRARRVRIISELLRVLFSLIGDFARKGICY